MTQAHLPSTEDTAGSIGAGDNQQRRRWLRRGIWLAMLLAALVTFFMWYHQRQSQASQVTYDTVEVAKRDITVTVSATGTIQPITKVDVGSELSGVAREVLAEENARVKAGEVLARLDTTRLEAQKEKAEAQLAAAQARVLTAQASLNQADLALTRQSRLRARSLSPEQDLELADAEQKRAAASLAAAQADVKSAEADLALVKADIAKAVIIAPINGIVLKRSVEPGQTVAASLQAPVLFTIAQDIARIQLEAAVDEADVGVVQPGQDASFTVDAYRERRFPAKIDRMSYAPETVDGVVTYKTILTADNSDLALRPGMTATARIIVAQHHDVLAVPNEALRYAPPRMGQQQGFSITQIFMPRFPRTERSKRDVPTDGMRSLYVLENGAPKELRVKVIASDGKYTAVESDGLEEKSSVITASRSGAQP